MISTDVLASTREASSVATATASANTIAYGEILSDLCRRIDGASYYSGSSSTWFLRGALGKYEETESGNHLLNSSSSSSFAEGEAFSPEGLTDVLLEKHLLTEEEESNDGEHGGEEGNNIHRSSNDQKNYENCLIVAKALAEDSSKYLPAIAASLSRLISLSASSSGAIDKRTTIVIPQEFLQLWVSIIVEDTTPQGIHENLSDDLFRVFLQQQRLRDSSDPLALPTHALFCLVEGDLWHNAGNHSAKLTSKSLSPPTTQATLRRASLLVRFLSHDSGCKALDFETKLGIATSSGAMEWFVKVLGDRDCPARHLKQRRETRLGLLDLLVDEWRIVTTSATAPSASASAAASTEWLFSPQHAEAVLLFFRETLLELVEDWNEHLEATSLQQKCATAAKSPSQGGASTSTFFQSRTNHDLLSKRNQKALGCATLFVKFLARLPKTCPVSSSMTIITPVEASKRWVGNKKQNGRELLVEMLRWNSNSKQEHGCFPPLQRMRLVRLVIDEFGSASNSCNSCISVIAESSDYDYTAKKEWLLAPGILAPILEECARDPFLGSSAATDRFLRAYLDCPSWKGTLSKKPFPRAAPAAIEIQASKPGGIDGIIASAARAVAAEKALHPKPVARLSRWFLEAAGRFQHQQQQQQPGQVPIPGEGGRGRVLRVLQNKLGDDFGIGNHTSNEDHYSLFDGGDRIRSNIFSELASMVKNHHQHKFDTMGQMHNLDGVNVKQPSPAQDQYSLFDGANV